MRGGSRFYEELGIVEKNITGEARSADEVTMKKLLLAVLALALIVSACSAAVGYTDTTDAAAGPTTTDSAATKVIESPPLTVAVTPDDVSAEELKTDVGRIELLFADYSTEWFVSLEAATAYIAENVYPSLGCTPESALDTYGGVDGQRELIVVLGDTAERADGWVMPIGPMEGDPIEGRVYSFVTETTVSAPGMDSAQTQDEAHATVIDDRAYFFFQCWDAPSDG